MSMFRPSSGTHAEPLPALPAPVSDRMLAAGRLAVVATVAIWLAFVVRTALSQIVERAPGSAPIAAVALYLLIVTLLAGSALAYLTTRLGYFYRVAAHRRVARSALDEFLSQTRRTLTVLVPAYQEEARVIRMTLLSAALQQYPGLRVVLLIDDPPRPRWANDERLLREARELAVELDELLAVPAARFRLALERFELRSGAVSGPALRELANEYAHAAWWLREQSREAPDADHAERFFARHVIGALRADLELVESALRAAESEGAALSHEQALRLHERLAQTFHAQISSFERKSYASLSHEPNKAMNLNSYIGLMGFSYREAATPSGTVLVPCAADVADLSVPSCDFILTLDADSVLLPEYCARMVHLMEQPQSSDVAVAQTPYCAYPGATTRLERIAGATTDVQHIVHQGLTYHNATFWVGANAVLRKRALDEMVETEHMGDWPVRRYIRDRTVIEDTESSIDLAAHGWRLHNYPERLSYSATPPDFGSLCVQRTRWANGGLIICAKLLRQLRAHRRDGRGAGRSRLGEGLLRLNYMASISWSSIALVLLLAYQFSDRLFDPLVFGIAAPYFLAMSSDLRHCGYRRIDVLRIYGFNLILLPVNLAGTYHSLVQALTGAKGRFRRTPKVRDRTTAGAPQILMPYAVVALSIWVGIHDLQAQRWFNLAFATINAVLGAYAVLAFIGLGDSLVDLWIGLSRPLRLRPRPAAATAEQPLRIDWRTALHYGGVDPERQVEGMPAAAPADVPAYQRSSGRFPRSVADHV